MYTIVISPFSRKLKNNKRNAKDYPYWKDLINILQGKENTVIQHDVDSYPTYHIIQLGIHGEEQLVDDFRTNLTLKEIRKIIQECDLWISVDNFLQHLANHIPKKGIVIWGPSDPTIFGYPQNINILKDRSSLRKNQFDIWDNVEFKENIFPSAQEIYKVILEQFTRT